MFSGGEERINIMTMRFSLSLSMYNHIDPNVGVGNSFLKRSEGKIQGGKRHVPGDDDGGDDGDRGRVRS